MELSIRPVREEDAGSIAALLNPIIQAGKYTIMTEQISVDGQARYIREFPEPGVFHVAVRHDSQEIVGLQSVEPASTTEDSLRHVGEISTFVSLASQRNGVGRSLSEATFQSARERGFRKILAAIRADNPDAVSFYRSQGFVIIGTARQHALVQGCYIDEVLAEKFLA
jgi:L-amino acid N-acyltransferase YncA